MRLSLPSLPVLQASAALVAVCGAFSCTPQQIVVEKPCPPVEYPVVKAPVAAPSTDEAVARTLDIRLTPVRNEGSNVVAVDVAMRFSVPPVDFGSTDSLILRLDPHIAGAAIADRIDDLTARDSEGSLGLRLGTENEAGKPARAEWKADRRPRGPVSVNYRVQLLAEDAARDEVISSAGGVVGIGRALFLMPATTETYTIHVSWDLQALGPGARGTSSFGTGDADIEGAPSLLENAIWVAGSLDEIAIRSSSTNSGPFRVISLGKSAFDVTEIGPWMNRVWLGVRNLGTNATNFDLIVRAAGKPGNRLDVDVFGLGAMATTQNDVKFGWPEKLHLTEAMAQAARGTNLMRDRWFDEGFGTYVALNTLRQMNLANPPDIAAEITKRSERYFASPWLRTPLTNLTGPKDAAVMAHIEDRGLFYAAELDTKIRVASGGKRSFVDFLRGLEPAPPAATDTTDAPKTTGITAAAFVKALEKEFGAEAVTRYRALVESGSALADAPDDAFGPCFKKAKKKIQREDTATKKRESVDGFVFAVVPKLPASCADIAPKAQVGGLQKTP